MSDNAFEAPSPEYLAELLPQYDIEFFIAQGGMGAVYKGRQISLDRGIAVKILAREMGQSKEFRDSFTSEAKAMARLNHSNLLGVFDYGNVEGMPYIVMEYVDGGSLHEAAWNQAVEPSQAVAIVKGICDGLAHAHEHGIVHRDIKPSNILLTPNIQPKVADFGLAHAAGSDTPGLVMGTPGYTAPEVFQDPNQAGKLADIYSVGVILHQLLTGIDPAGSMGPPTQSTGNIRLDAIWRKATHAIPSQRHPSIAAMASDLGKWIEAKQKAPVVVNRAPLNAPRSPVHVPTSSGGGLRKFFVIGTLGAGIVFTYQLLQEPRQDPKKGNSEIKGADTSGTPPPPSTPVSAPPPVPVSLPAEDDEPSALPDAEPIEIPAGEDPVIVADEDEEPESVGDQPPGDPELRERAIGFILDARKKRDKEFADNASALLSSLKTLASHAEDEELAYIDVIKESIVNHRVPIADGDGIPAKIAKALTHASAKEDSAIANYLSDLTRIRDAYVTRLEAAATEASDEDVKKSLLAQVERASDLGSWAELLAPEPETERVVVKGLGVSFAGNWDNHSQGKVQRFIAHPDGRLEVVGKKWEILWVIVEDGSLELRWPDSKVYKYTRDGEGWSGETSFGHPTDLLPGDW